MSTDIHIQYFVYDKNRGFAPTADNSCWNCTFLFLVMSSLFKRI